MIKLKRGMRVFKKAFGTRHRQWPVIITLWLPKGTRVNKALPKEKYTDVHWWRDGYRGLCKLRADQAVVKRIVLLDDSRRTLPCAYSAYHSDFQYRVGDQVRPNFPFDCTNAVCSSGIHFFLTRQEAKNYDL